ISPAALEMARQAGFRWAATDEILLSRAFGKPIKRDADGIPVDAGWFYRPYAAATSSGPIPLFFRDHRLSDLIGFEYSRWDAHDAANNFIHNIKLIHNRLSSIKSVNASKEYVIPIILDGENAWEYYHDSGVTFLNSLLSKLEALRPNIEYMTLTDVLENTEEIAGLPSNPTGSWIDGTFHIWIGHAEDHAAWEMLSRARSLWELKSSQYLKAGKELPPELEKARDCLLVAEGSDWCWWYGDDHFTPHGPEFDRLFRHNVKVSYKEMGINPPDSIDIPIIKMERVSKGENFIVAPRSYIQPRIDGVVTSYFEWNSATRVVPTPEFGTMHRAGHIILSCFYFGFSIDDIFFRFDLDKVAIENVQEIELELLFQNKYVKFGSRIDPKNDRFSYSFMKIGETAGKMQSGAEAEKEPGNVRAAFGKVLEMAIPIEALDCRTDRHLDFFVTIQAAGSFGERWPMYGTYSAELPGTDFIERMWQT
ncbi:MAG: hypothetical protein IH577_00800, partial [Deltaproteobacteria bacterium]|nr:hypothetical protein [Deltaproteobacteria bacterium]